MSTDKLGRYMTSEVFLARANAAIASAASKLEAEGIKPVYLDRKTGRIVGDRDDTSRANGSCEGRRAPDILNSEDPSTGRRNER